MEHDGVLPMHGEVHVEQLGPGNQCRMLSLCKGIELLTVNTFQYEPNADLTVHPLLPLRTLTVTMIEGGEKENVIPSFCSFLLDIRPFPGDTYADMETLIHKHLSPLKEKDPQFDYTLTKVLDVFPGELPTDHEWTKKIVSIHNTAFGGDTKARDFGATCEQCFLLAKGIPTVIAGPGSMAQAHIIDEYIDIDQLEKGVLFYKQVIADAFKD